MDKIPKNSKSTKDTYYAALIWWTFQSFVVCKWNVYQVDQFYVLSSKTVYIFYNKIEIKRDGGTYFIQISSCYLNLAENTMSLFYNYQLTWKKNDSTMIW